MTTFIAIDGSTVTPRTRADLMQHPAFADLGSDTDGNPCVWLNSYTCQSCTSEQIDWFDDWTCGCDDDCPNCGESHSPHDQQWLANCDPHDDVGRLWESLPDAGSPEAEKAIEDAVMADHDAYVDRRETATIIAALRFYQRNCLGGPSTFTSYAESDIATDGGEIEPMTADEIDMLCERINSRPVDF